MQLVKLGEVSSEFKENFDGDKKDVPIVGLEHIVPKELKLTSWELNSNNTFTKSFKKGDILFGRRRAYQKKACIAENDGICSGDIIVIRANPQKIHPKLLPFIIQNDHLFDYAIEKSAGSLSPRVKWNHLKNFKFNLPDLSKQEILADTLWSIEKTIESYKQLIEHLDLLNKSRFIELFGDIKEKNKWPREKWSDVCEIINGKDFKSVEDPNGQYAVYGTGGFMAKANQYTCPENSIIIGRKGTINKPLLVKEKFWNIDTAFGVVPNITKVHYQYFYWFCKQFNFMSINKGTTLPSTTKTDLQKIEINVPPLELQLHFSHLVDQIDKSKFNLKCAINELNSLIDKITSELFS